MNTTQAMALVSVEEIIGMHVELHSARYMWGTAVCRRRCAGGDNHDQKMCECGAPPRWASL